MDVAQRISERRQAVGTAYVLGQRIGNIPAAQPHRLGNVLRELLLRQPLRQRIYRREIGQPAFLPRLKGGRGHGISAAASVYIHRAVKAPDRADGELALKVFLIEKSDLRCVCLVAGAEFEQRHPARQPCGARLRCNGQHHGGLAAVAPRLAQGAHVPAVLICPRDMIYKVAESFYARLGIRGGACRSHARQHRYERIHVRASHSRLSFLILI